MSDGAGDVSRRAALAAVAVILVIAAWLRFEGLDWDQGQHLHPDERFLTMVETAIAFPRTMAGYLDTATSPLNPANRGYRFFVYGTLPLFLVRLSAAALGALDYGHVHLVGRALSAAFDVGSVALVYGIGALVAGRRAGVIACALAAFSVTSIQNAHFFTVDSPGTFFTTAALLALVRFARDGSVAAEIAFGALLACAVGCRINLALIGLAFPPAFALAWWRRGRPVRLAAGALAAGLVGAVTFRVVQPYAFAGPGFFGLAIAPTFLASLREIRGMVAGEVDFPPSVQWIGRVPIVFPARNLLGWGIGPLWGATAVIGLGYAFSRRARGREVTLGRGLLAWAVLFFGYHAWQFAPTGRYFLPVVPLLAVSAGWVLGAGTERWRRLTALVVVGATACWAFAFTAIHRRPMTRVEASRWIYANVPADKTLAIEHWDDGLPLVLPDVRRIIYRTIELHLYDDDTDGKRETLLDQLAETDYVILSSNRLYRSIPREPWRYPMTRRYYELLFSGELGFRLARSFTSYPRLGPLEIPDDGAEEAFTVYDHPRVLIFEKTEAFSRARAAELLGAVALGSVQRVSPAEASRLYRRMQPTDIPVPDGSRLAIAAYGESGWFALARWLLALEALALAVFAILAGPLAALPDRGFALAKPLAWLAPGYVAWLLASTGLAPSGVATSRAVALGVLAAGAVAGWRRRSELRAFAAAAPRELWTAEIVFLAAFAMFALARAFHPAIYWGEKPMDFAFLNALLRTRSMPPPDPWFAGGTLNYFYFGHALVACFAQITGTAPELAFNLAIATVAGLLAVACYAFGRVLGGGVVGGVAAAFAVTLLGNLAGVRLLLEKPHRPLNFDYFWSTSRVIPDTINEFPVWNLLFADLHAHVMAQPFEVALLAVGLAWGAARRDGDVPPRWIVVVLAAWLLGTVSATSTWSTPCTAALQLAFLVSAWRARARGRARALVAAVAGWLVVVVLSRALFWPFWSHYVQPAGVGYGRETAKAPLGDVLTIFGAFLVTIVPVLLARLLGAWREAGIEQRRRLAVLVTVAAGLSAAAALAAARSPSAGLFAALAALGAAVWLLDAAPAWRIVGLLVAVAGGLGLGTELVFVSDRMNTVFKFYLEAWLLLGCAAGAMTPLAWRSATAWRLPWATGVALVTAAGLFTAISGALGLVRSPFVPSDVPTLDGMNYLEHTRPHEREAFRWMRREIAGVPVLLEAHGDSYGEFGRVSMNTGLPAVVGWEFHLFQQGHPWSDIYARRDDVRALYATTDLELAARLMKKYAIDVVFVGALERRTYPAEGLAKFGAWPLTSPVFQRGDVTIYATPGLLSADKTWVEPADAGTARATIAAPFGSFAEPRDLARAPDGTFWVADFGNGRVQHLAADRKPLGGFGSPGERPGQFHDPCGIAVDADGSIFVADTWNHRVQKLAPNGTTLAEWRPGLYGPRGLAIDRLGRVYVTDTGNDRVLRMSPRGVVERVWGKDGDVLSQPVGIAIGPGDEVYVADTGHRRVVVFSANGVLLRQWPIDGWNPTTIVEPHVDVGPDGTVWVADPSGNRVLVFDAYGKPAGHVAAVPPFSIPVGIAVVDGDHAIVTNAGGHSLSLATRAANTSVAPPR